MIGDSPSVRGGCHVSVIELRSTSLTARGPRGAPGTSARINMYNFRVNVTVVIEHIVLLTAARALISVSYVYLRLFFCLCLFVPSLFIT